MYVKYEGNVQHGGKRMEEVEVYYKMQGSAEQLHLSTVLPRGKQLGCTLSKIGKSLPPLAIEPPLSGSPVTVLPEPGPPPPPPLCLYR